MALDIVMLLAGWCGEEEAGAGWDSGDDVGEAGFVGFMYSY